MPELVLQRLLWLPRVVVVCAYVGAAPTTTPKPANLPCQLLLYPRYHLDHSSLLARYPLPQVGSLKLVLLAVTKPVKQTGAAVEFLLL